jgi:hypothetical protein
MELVSNKGDDASSWIEELFLWPICPMLPLAEGEEKERKCMLIQSY